ncbi:MAG: RHS repeat-associated core domain-containing protein [Kiritimatiellia bacterium]
MKQEVEMGFYQTQSCVSRPVRAASPVRKKTADTPVFRNNQLENRLIGAETLSTLPSSVPRVKLEFAYDYMSRRVSKKVYKYESEIWNLQSEMRFAYDGWNLIREITTTPIPPYSVTNSYVWGLDLSGSLQGAGGIGGLLAARLGTNNVCYTYDANGNVAELLQSTAYGPQSILAHYEYSPFGETIVATGAMAKENKFRFSTKYTDDETGLVYYGYRYYSPSLGRWLSRDPIDAIMLNLYGFVDNNVMNYVDTDGRSKSGGGGNGGGGNGGGTTNVPLWWAHGNAAPNSIMCIGGGVGICVRGATDAIDEKCILPCVKHHEACHARQAAPYSPCVGKSDGGQVGINPDYPNARHIFACFEVECHQAHVACLQEMYKIPECKCAVIPEMNRVMQNLRAYISECGR